MSLSTKTLEIKTPRVFVPLLAPSRYKGLHGGRGSGKSHFFAECIVERALMTPGFRAVCIREVQKSLAQSSKLLIEDKIQSWELGGKFRILEKEIQTPGDGLIIFQGMQNHTAETIKSLEGYDVAWCAESQTLSARSLRLLRPTIRKPKSELWFDWNPESDQDPVDELLRGHDRIKDAVVVQANWKDNPWFPAELEAERIIDLERRPEEYDHTWEGAYVTISDAIIFRNRVSVEEFEAPKTARLYFGADWGFANDPTVLTRSFIENDILYIEYEAFGLGVEMDELPAMFDQVPGSRQWPIKADSARPETISFMRNKYRFNISPAAKWSGSVEDGVSRMKGFKKIVIHPRCVNTIKEFRMYAYKVDRKTEDVLPIIVDAWNHAIDSVRYALDGIITNSRAPVRISPDLMNRARQMRSA